MRGCLLSLAVLASIANAEFTKGAQVVLYANKVRRKTQTHRDREKAHRKTQVGPFANPNEVYAFYSLPYCAPTEIETKRENMGALLKGDRPTKTLYDLKFLCAPLGV